MAAPDSYRDSVRRGLVATIKRVALIGARRPFLALAIGVVLVAISGVLLAGLKISTSRRDLVSAEHPSQRRTLEFDDKFGYPNAPAIIVTGGSQEDRRKVVDAIEREVESLPNMDQRVLGRVHPEDIAEVLLVADPESIAKAIPPDDQRGDGAKKLEDGFVGWVQLLDGQLQAGLDQEEIKASDADMKDGFTRLKTLFGAFQDELEGKSGLVQLADLQNRGQISRGLDELGYVQGGGGHNIIGLFPMLEGDEGYEVRPVVRELREARDRAVAASGVQGVRADVTGLPALVTDELAMIERDLAVTSIAATIAMVLTLYWGFRSFRQAMVSFLPLGFGTVVTFGIVRLILGKLNLITASFTSVLLGLGDFGVHIQRGFSDLLKKGHPPKAAMQEAMLHAGPGLLIGTLSVSVAFLTTLVTEFTAFAELGLIVSVGLVVMLAGTYLLVPAAVLILLGKKPRPSPELPGFRRLAAFVKAWPKSILLASLAITVFFACFLPRVTFNGRYFDFLPTDTESARGLRVLQDDQTANPFVANLRAKSIDEARDFAERLRALDTVSSVETPSDFFPKLDEPQMTALKKVVHALEHDGKPVDLAAAANKQVDREAFSKELGNLRSTMDEVAFALRSGGREDVAKSVDAAKAQLTSLREQVEKTDPARLSQLQKQTFSILHRAQTTARNIVERGGYSVEDLPPLFQHRFVSKDKTEVALFIHPKGDIWEVPVAEKFTKDISAISPEVSGIATTLAEHPKLIVRGFERASVLAAILVLFILGVSFRRPADVLTAAMPLVLASVWMLGAMPLMGMQFNHANMVVLPLLLGLGVESGAHIMSRYRQSLQEHDGVAKLDDILGSTGSAVFVAVLTTIFGFSVMMLADYRAMFGLGLIMTVGMSATLVLSLVALPACLVLLKRAE
ncbi:MAG: MMPL family transporter [Polyangiaceae bacterium]|nr:MMPL family transporter [Polyangiaceae bacterium]